MTITINPPLNGRPVAINAARADVSAYHKAGPDLILVFNDGRSIIITDYYLRPLEDGSQSLEFSDGAYPVAGTHAGDDSFVNMLALTATGLVATGALTAIVSEGRSTPDRLPNRPPEARDDYAEAGSGETIYINVLANDTDADGDELTIPALSDPSIGDASIVTTEDGQQLVKYMAPQGGIYDDYFEIYIFDYTVTDGNGETATAEISVALDPWQPGDPPVYPFGPPPGPEDQPQATGTTLSASAMSGADMPSPGIELHDMFPADQGPGEAFGQGGLFASADAGPSGMTGNDLALAFDPGPGVNPLGDPDLFPAEPVL